MNAIRNRIGTSALAALLGGAVTAPLAAQPQPDFAATAPRGGPKAIVATFRLSGEGATSAETTLVFGVPARALARSGAYRLSVVDAGGAEIAALWANDPRTVIVEQQGNVQLAEGLLSLRIAFDPRARQLVLRDRGGVTLATADLAGAVSRFCREAPDDGDCSLRRGR